MHSVQDALTRLKVGVVVRDVYKGGIMIVQLIIFVTDFFLELFLKILIKDKFLFF